MVPSILTSMLSEVVTWSLLSCPISGSCQMLLLAWGFILLKYVKLATTLKFKLPLPDAPKQHPFVMMGVIRPLARSGKLTCLGTSHCLY